MPARLDVVCVVPQAASVAAIMDVAASKEPTLDCPNLIFFTPFSLGRFSKDPVARFPIGPDSLVASVRSLIQRWLCACEIQEVVKTNLGRIAWIGKSGMSITTERLRVRFLRQS
jgi:hypothetical protein